jgi:hypothetical protein
MNDTAELDLLPIDTAPPVAQTAVAVAASQALDLEKMDLAAIVRSGFQPARDKAAEATKTLTGVVHDLSTQAKVDAAISLRQRLIKDPVADVRKLTKGIKSKLTAASMLAGEQEEQVLAGFTAAEALITPQIDAAKAKLEAERQAKAAAESARKAKHEENLQRLTVAPQRARETGADSTKIAEGIAALEVLPISEAWEEFRERAEAARVAAIEALRALHAEVLAREQQAAENERLRALAEQQAAELKRLRQAEAARQEAETQALVASIRAESRRVEWPKNPAYIHKAMIAFENMAPSWEGDPREAVREATAEGRRYLGGLLAEAEASLAQATPNSSQPGPVAGAAEAAPSPDEGRAVTPGASNPKAAPNTEGLGSQQVLKAEPATADATDRDAPAVASPGGGPMGVGQAAAAAPAVAQVASTGTAIEDIRIDLGDLDTPIETSEREAIAPAPAPTETAGGDIPCLSLGEVNARFGDGADNLGMSCAYIERSLGEPPTGFSERKTPLYSERALARIALAIHKRAAAVAGIR